MRQAKNALTEEDIKRGNDLIASKFNNPSSYVDGLALNLVGRNAKGLIFAFHEDFDVWYEVEEKKLSSLILLLQVVRNRVKGQGAAAGK
jgi:hypothetical protein